MPAQTSHSMRTSLAPSRRGTLLLRHDPPGEFQRLVGAPDVVAKIPECYGARHVPGVARLHIPTCRITNGPVGIGQSEWRAAHPAAKSARSTDLRTMRHLSSPPPARATTAARWAIPSGAIANLRRALAINPNNPAVAALLTQLGQKP